MKSRQLKSKPSQPAPTGKQKEQIITRIIEKFNSRTKKDIKDWRKALAAAENIDRPNRVLLYNLYDEVELDLHYTGCVEHQRYDKLFSEVFRLVDATDGKEDKDLTDFFKGDWFFDTQRYTIEEKLAGTSLIQIGELIDSVILKGKKTIAEVTLIPRRHVRPEYGEILTDQNDERGYPYRNDEAMMYWLIEVGKPRDLGLLKKIAPVVLFKKNAMSAWSEYIEIFGMPTRVGKTNSREQKDLDRMEETMQKAAKSAYMIFNEGESVSFIESTKGDAYNVYDKFIERCDLQISKAILGQTLTTDSGSSGTRAQGEVHERTADFVLESDKRAICSMVNDKLLPLLLKRGLPVANRKFEFNEMKDLGALFERTKGFLTYYDVPEDWINDTFGIPVVKKAQSTEPGAPDEPVEDDKPKPAPKAKPEKKKLSHSPAWLDELYTECQCGNHAPLKLAAEKQSDLDRYTGRLLQRIWSAEEEVTFDAPVSNVIAEILIDGLIAGWQNKKKLQLGYRSTVDLSIDYTSPDWETITQMEANLFRFSAAKTLSLVNELNAQLPDSKTFDDFKKNTKGILTQYNENHLRTEYNFAWATAQNAAEYHRMIAQSETYPYWQYITAGDARVRPAHAKLDKMTFKADDEAFDLIYTPNDWGCRCYVKPLRSYPESKLSTKDDALDALASTEVDEDGTSALDRMRKNGMDINRAKTGEVFTANQMYAKDAFGAKLGVKDNGVTPYESIAQGKLPKLKQETRDKEFARDWYKENVKEETVADYAQRPIEFSQLAFEEHIKPKYEKMGRLDILEFIPDVLNNPDEVYMQKRAEGAYQYLYMKFYKDKVLAVPAELNEGARLTIKSWFEVDKQLDDRRSGILIKNKGR